MAQKYKVFIDNKVIYFTDVELIGIKKIDFFYPSNFFELNETITKDCQVISNDPKSRMFNFFENFKFIEAAGGIVVSENKFLFIKRNGLWDIPKGKMESNETPDITAIREIQEECGLKGELSIRKKLLDTFHTYEFKNKSVLKKTHWFLLDYSGNKKTKPQLEEGITAIEWFELKDFSQIKNLTYSSIIDVLTYYENS
jgi:8-oxo-dGTP pyrophosphatase MutT (NUDIX family)